MNVKLFFVINCILSFHHACALLENYHAFKAYKNNDLDGAHTLLNTVVNDNPDDAQALYNLGKIAYKKGEFETAGAYFSKAAHAPHVSALQEQALFDGGNSYAQLKQWPEAIKNYEDVLARNPDHEPAKKTLEQIKKIMEQEKQQQQQEEQKKDEQKKEEEKKENDKKDQKESDQNQQNGDKNQDDHDEDQKNDKDGDTQKKNDAQKSKDENQDNPHQKDQDNQQQKNKQQDKQQDDVKKENKNEGQPGEQRNERTSQQQQQQAQQQGNGQKKESGQAQSRVGDEKQEKLDYETLLLQQAENNDAAMSKMLLQRQLKTETVRHGQKNW